MAAPVVAAGVGLGQAGEVYGDIQQANAENANQQFYGEQAEFAQKAGDRAEYLINQKENDIISQQLSSFAKAGVQVQGSALQILGETARRAESERQAARTESDFNVRLARLRQQASADRQKALLDPMTWLLRGGGAIAGAGGQMASQGAFSNGGNQGFGGNQNWNKNTGFSGAGNSTGSADFAGGMA